MVKRKYQDLEQENASIADGSVAKEAEVDDDGENSAYPYLGRNLKGNCLRYRVEKEEHGHGSESTKRVVNKKAKGKGKSNNLENKKPATRRRNNKIGVLESIMIMPFDIVCEIAANLSPGDLLSMARSCKMLRDLFTSKQSKPIWSAARMGVSLPDCPADISEMKFADLIFCKGCYQCEAPRANFFVSIPCKLRLCRPCFFKSLMDKESMKKALNLDDWFFSLLSTDSGFYSSLYNIYEAKEVQKQYQSLDLSSDEAAVFISERKQCLLDIKPIARKVTIWMNWKEKMKDKAKMAIIRDRSLNIRKRLLESGYSETDFRKTHGNWEMNRKWDLLLNDPKPLTDRIWNNLKPKLENIILDRRMGRWKIMRSHGHAPNCICLYPESECSYEG